MKGGKYKSILLFQLRDKYKKYLRRGDGAGMCKPMARTPAIASPSDSAMMRRS